MTIGMVLEQRRSTRGISYAELARRTDINEDMVSRFCNEKSMPKGDQLVRLCCELDLEICDFDGVAIPSRRTVGAAA